MTPIELALSFVISYVAGIVPNDWFKKHKSMNEKLELCFKEAVYKWTNHSETRKAVGEQMVHYLPKLKDYIAHKSIGRHPRENDLLRLWAEEILNDERCHQFILEYEQEINLLKLEEGLLTAKEILEETENIKIQIELLKNRGITNCFTYWEQWAIGPDLKFNTEILLAGREEERQEIVKNCNTPNCLYVEAVSTKEAMAFVVASVISESKTLVDRTVVVTNDGAYKDMVKECSGMIFITDIQENAHYVVSRGNSVILCICPSDNHNESLTIHLPRLNREGFIKSLTESGMDEARARDVAIDSARDISALRNLLRFPDNRPVWQTPENIRLIIPTLLIGQWNEEWSNDKDLVRLMTGKDYADYLQEIAPLLLIDEAPLVRIGKIWKVKSPLELMGQFINYITQPLLDKLNEVFEWIMQDDDPDAEAKMNEESLLWWQNRQAFSGEIKEGVFQGITLLSIVRGRYSNNTDWVDNLIGGKLKDFNLKRYLSHRHNLHWLVEASPSSFLKYVNNDIKEGSPLICKLMDVKHKKFSLVGSEIYYTELLFALESISWDNNYLYDATDILLHLCSYPNDSNYSNKPINSLIGIYRFILPQTYTPFEHRVEILKNLAGKHRQPVYRLSFALLKGLDERVFMPNRHFRWRMRENKEAQRHAPRVPQANVLAIAQLLLETTSFSVDEIKDILELSSSRNMDCCRSLLLDFVHKQKDRIKGNENVTKVLRKIICWHRQYNNANWALTEEKLRPYEELLNELESDDILIRNKHFFEDYWIEDPNFRTYNEDYPKKNSETRNIRKNIIDTIIDQNGLDAVWTFEKLVKFKEGVANAIVDIFGIEWNKDIYKRYCTGNLDETFVRQYFSTIYYEKGDNVYFSIIEELKVLSDKKISILLYAPGYQKSLSEMAMLFPSDIEKDYWAKVNIWSYSETDTEIIIKKLCAVERYADVLRLVVSKNNMDNISEDTKISVLNEIQIKDKFDILTNNAYQVAAILQTISLPQDINRKNLLLQMELFLFEHLKHHIRMHDMHLVQGINKEPTLLMELYTLAFKADEGYEEERPKNNSEKEFRTTIAQIAFNFIYEYHEVPCSDASGNVNEKTLSDYFEEMKRQAEECHRTHILPTIIGRILGNFKETEDYPSDTLCRFVERFSDDNVDTEISCALSNRRGMTSRAFNEGGTIEKKHIETFIKYRDRTRLRSPRLTHIFDNLIKEYQQMAEKEDNRATFLDITN